MTYPADTDRAFPLIRKLKYRPEVAPAVQQVFARTLLCPDLDTATDMARRSQLNCITLDGDEANRKGTLTGGYTDNLTLKLEAWRDFSVRCTTRQWRFVLTHTLLTRRRRHMRWRAWRHSGLRWRRD